MILFCFLNLLGQRKQWEDEHKLAAGQNWRRVVKDRKQWQLLEEAFAKWHTEYNLQKKKI